MDPIRRRLVRLAPRRAWLRSPWNRSAQSPDLGRGFAIAGLVIAWATAALIVVGLAVYFGNSG